ncbi:PIN domain-containing protein [Kribbella sp. CA-247076]|uniref:PIN domain-containing protein n=1 Tax=Kribbella sp. CA-247076 TaxID=3239941 RepID=UPI003D8AC844
MTASPPTSPTRTERAFLDANVIRGQLTNDILMSVAHRDVFEPRWSQHVLDEMRRNRPEGVSEEKIDKRIATMNKVFPKAMTSGYEDLEPQMQADPKDKHVLAAAVRSESAVLVTDNVKDFNPPSTGPNAMRVEKLSQFLSRKLQENPQQVQGALQDMVNRNKRDPRTMSQLLDKMAAQPELRAFAQNLNSVVPPDQRGTAEVLTANQRGSAASKAFSGLAPAGGAAQVPAETPQARKGDQPSQNRSKKSEKDL